MRKVLLVETALLGDVIVATPAIRVVANKFPQAEINIVMLEQFKSVIVDNPNIHCFYTLRSTNLYSLYQLIAKLRRQSYDLVVAFSPGVRNSMITLLSGAHFLSGYLVCRSNKTYFFQDHFIEAVGMRGRWVYDRLEHLSIRALKSLAPLGIVDEVKKVKPELNIDSETEIKFVHLLYRYGCLKKDAANVVIHPTAGWSYKQWHNSNLISLIDRLKEEFGEKINITFIGAPGEREFLKSFQANTTGSINILTENDLRMAMVLIKNCDLFIGNDSGPKHIADAYSLPLIELLGPGMPKTVGAVGNHAVSVYHPVGCNPCPQQSCDNEMRCMKAISVDEVFAAARNVLKQNGVNGK